MKKKYDQNQQRRRSDYNPHLAELARKFTITCFLCQKEKQVAVEPIEGVPVICDDCKEDLDAKRLIYQNEKNIKSIKRLTCKACHEVFYAPDETHLVCHKCYLKFSEQVISKTKQLQFFTCERCGARESLYKKVYDEKNVTLCRHCLKIARRKERLKKVRKKQV